MNGISLDFEQMGLGKFWKSFGMRAEEYGLLLLQDGFLFGTRNGWLEGHHGPLVEGF